MKSFTLWLAATPLSEAIQANLWIIPAIQSIHILALAVVMSSALLLHLKMAGIALRSQSAVQVGQRFLPWLWIALAVMAVSGSLLVIGEPDRSLRNAAFWVKMALICLAVLATCVLTTLSLRAGTGKGGLQTSGMKLAAALGIVIWCAVAVAGRWIAYVDVE